MTGLLLSKVEKHELYRRDLARFHFLGRRDDVMRADRMEQRIEAEDGYPPGSQLMQPLLDTIEGSIFQDVCRMLSHRNPSATTAIVAQYGNMRILECNDLMITYAVIQRDIFNLILLLALDHPHAPRAKSV
jgi:hypothetical protein